MVGFCAVLPQPTGTADLCKRVSRLVILPDYQGLGVGTRFLDAICQHYLEMGFKVYIRSAHVKLAGYWARNPNWRATARNGKKGELNGVNHSEYSVSRECYSYEYVGPEFQKPHLEIAVDSLDGIDLEALPGFLQGLRKDHYLTVVHGSTGNNGGNRTEVNRICCGLGIRTELLRVHGKLSRKRIGDRLLLSLDSNGTPVWGKVVEAASQS